LFILGKQLLARHKKGRTYVVLAVMWRRPWEMASPLVISIPNST